MEFTCEQQTHEVVYSEEEYHQNTAKLIFLSGKYIQAAFLRRWKSETGSTFQNGNQTQLEEFLNTEFGKTTKRKLKSFQLKIFKEWNVDSWDIPLLNIVMQNFGDKDKYKLENDAVYHLQQLRNDISHSSVNRQSKAEFNTGLETIRESCLVLGASAGQLDNEIQLICLSASHEAWKLAKDKLDTAQNLMQTGNHSEAITVCDEALSIPSLFPEHRGKIYELRAEVQLSKTSNSLSDSDKIQALIDLEEALTLNDRSWRVHFLLGKLSRLNDNLEQAIVHFQKALAINPERTDVRNELDGCKVTAGHQSREDHFDPRLMPMDLHERLQIQEDVTSLKLTKEEFFTLHQEIEGALFPGQRDTFLGHCYRHGWDKCQNYKLAAECYAKADKLDNPEGTYNLGTLYEEGLGVEQNVETALNYYIRAASMPIDKPGIQTNSMKKNVGVAAAQHAIGKLYFEGTHLPKNLQLATEWFTKAMMNGVGNAANNLGIIYNQGGGTSLSMDPVMAEMCWKFALELKDVNAPANLAIYYMNYREPDKLLAMIKVGKEMQNGRALKHTSAEIQKMVQTANEIRNVSEKDVIEFETKNHLPTKGWTFVERLRRQQIMQNSSTENMWKLTDFMKQEKFSNLRSEFGGQLNREVAQTEKFQTELNAKVATVRASKIEKSVAIMLTYKLYLDFLFTNTIDFNFPNELAKELITLLYNLCTIELALFRNLLKNLEVQILSNFVAIQYKLKCKNPGNEDMKIRLCYTQLVLGPALSSKSMESIDVLEEGVKRYPNNEHLITMLVYTANYKNDYQLGLKYARLGVQRFPKSEDLQYALAVCLKQTASNSIASIQNAIHAYEIFLGMADKDHRKTPEAYYQISMLYLRIWFMTPPEQETERSNVIAKIQENYNKGVEAEKYQMACFLPYGKSPDRRSVEIVLQLFGKVDITNKPSSYKTGLLDRKPYLRSPGREALLKEHRQDLLIFHQHKSNFATRTKGEAKLKQFVPKNMTQLKPITLLEMNPTRDCIYENRILQLVILEEPYQSVEYGTIAEDENGDAVRLYIYDMEQNEKVFKNFGVGCKIGIANPYMRLTRALTHAIRVDEPKCLVFQGKIESMCRACGERNAQRKCVNCNSMYCSRECEILDWKSFGHKLICKKK